MEKDIIRVEKKTGKWYSNDKETQEYMEKCDRESELRLLKKYYPKQYEEVMKQITEEE